MSSAWRRLGLLLALYLSQGLPFGFYSQALPAILRDKGASLPVIGSLGALALPWSLKFLWAPWVDRHWSPRWGRRRSWILPLQALIVAALVAVGLLDLDAQLGLVLGGFFLLNLFAATQDIATDGLAVELLAREERGLGNGVQVAGYRLGMIIGGGLLLVLLGEIGWRAAFFVMAAVALVCTLPTALHTEAPPASVEGAAVVAGPQPGAFEIFARFFRRPGALPWLGFLALFKAGEAMGVSMLRPMLVDRGLSLTDIGWVLGGAGFSAGLLGALAGGAALQPLGRRRALLLFGALQALMVGGYALLAMVPLPLPGTLLLCVGEHFTSGLATAVLFTWMMDACGAEHAGTDYTIQASVVVFATGIAGAVAGFSAAALGYPAHFALSGLVALTALLPPLLNRGAFRLLQGGGAEGSGA